MAHESFEPQLDWDAETLRAAWPTSPDNFFVMSRLCTVPAAVTAAAGAGRVLEVAAAEAVHSCRMNRLGMESYVVEPSPAMLQQARDRIREYGVQVHLVRGIAEALPFPDATFDRVLLDSAIDHLASPQLSLAEMTRILRADGRLVVGFVNYASLSVRLSRLLYRAGRALRLLPRDQHLFWDTPVPFEHTFECTPARLQQLCAPYLELDHTFGVSLGWGVPGWGAFLARLPKARALAVLSRLDRVARRRPGLADFVISVWQPRPAADGAPRAGALSAASASKGPSPPAPGST